MKNKEEPKKELLKYFEDLYYIEKQAKDMYDDFLREIKNKKDREEIVRIRDDEIKHMKIVEKIKEIIAKK